jgi:hypothetical protein
MSVSVEEIKERNARVEADKAWETSWTRRLVIFIVTYIVASFYFSLLHVDHAFLHGLVPSGAYLISTSGLPYFKRWWTDKIYKRGHSQ